MEVQSLEKYIREHPFFADLPTRHLETIVGCASNVRFDPKEFVFRAGRPCDVFYLVRHGTVALEVHAAQTGTVRIQTISAGGIMGWSWLVPPYRAHFDARVTTLTRAVAFDGKCLRQKFEKDPELGFELMKRFSTVVTRRLESTQLQLLDLYGEHA